jgi:phosphoribosyl-ATP pyrophosphohydrolase
MDAQTLIRLQASITARRDAAPGSSYVASLFAKGLPEIAQKVGEEAIETVIAALSGDAKDIACEAADLIFHLLVLLEASDVPFDAVLAELDRREGVSGLDEKASRFAAVSPVLNAEPEPVLALGREPAKRPLIRKG